VSRALAFEDPEAEREFFEAMYAGELDRRTARHAAALVAWIVAFALVAALRPDAVAGTVPPNVAVVAAFLLVMVAGRQSSRARYQATLLVANVAASLTGVYVLIVGLVMLGAAAAAAGTGKTTTRPFALRRVEIQPGRG